MNYLNRCVVCYDEWQYSKVTSKELIRSTADELEDILNENPQSIPEEREWEIRFVIDKLRNPQSPDTCSVFPLHELLNGLRIPEDDMIYIVKNKEFYYE